MPIAENITISANSVRYNDPFARGHWMQERYLGDSHDFIKYALLRHLHRDLALRLGVNWYLARPENVDRPGNNDGEKRHHLNGGVWRAIDPILFDKIVRFEDPKERQLNHIAKWDVLPDGTLYHSQNICSTERQEWQSNGLKALAGCDLIFFDPDNGFQVASMTKRTAPKYALYSEVAATVDMGKAVVVIQFARQCDPIARAHEVRARLLGECGSDQVLPVVRGRVAPNILFISVAPRELASKMASSLESFCMRSEKLEIIP